MPAKYKADLVDPPPAIVPILLPLMRYVPDRVESGESHNTEVEVSDATYRNCQIILVAGALSPKNRRRSHMLQCVYWLDLAGVPRNYYSVSAIIRQPIPVQSGLFWHLL